MDDGEGAERPEGPREDVTIIHQAQPETEQPPAAPAPDAQPVAVEAKPPGDPAAPAEGSLLGPNLSKEAIDGANANVHVSGEVGEAAMTPALPSQPTGPTQGADPGIAIDPSVGAGADDLAGSPLPEPSVGPAQTPVLRATPHAADRDAMEWNARFAPEATAKRDVGDLDDAETDVLAQMVRDAYRRLSRETMTDAFGRSWSATYGPVNNQGAITVACAGEGTYASTVLATSGLATADMEPERGEDGEPLPRPDFAREAVLAVAGQAK